MINERFVYIKNPRNYTGDKTNLLEHLVVFNKLRGDKKK